MRSYLSSPFSPKKTKRTKRLILGSLVFLILFMGTLYASHERFIKWFIIKTSQKQGIQLSLDTLTNSFRKRTLHLTKIHLRHNQATVIIDHITLRYTWRLFKKQLTIDTLNLHNVAVQLQKNQTPKTTPAPTIPNTLFSSTINASNPWDESQITTLVQDMVASINQPIPANIHIESLRKTPIPLSIDKKNLRDLSTHIQELKSQLLNDRNRILLDYQAQLDDIHSLPKKILSKKTTETSFHITGLQKGWFTQTFLVNNLTKKTKKIVSPLAFIEQWMGPKASSKMLVWFKSIQLTTDDPSYYLSGTLQHISSDQSRTNQASAIDLTYPHHAPQPLTCQLQGQLDYRSTPNTTLTIQIKGPIDPFTIAHIDQQPLILKQGQFHLNSTLKQHAKQLNGTLKLYIDRLKTNSTQFKTNTFSLSRLITHILDDLNHVTINGRLSGSVTNPTLFLTSNLDRIMNKNLSFLTKLHAAKTHAQIKSTLQDVLTTHQDNLRKIAAYNRDTNIAYIDNSLHLIQQTERVLKQLTP